jgi:hypothetical protein
MNDFLKAPKTKTLLWILCSVLVVLVAFGLGIIVGYRRAIFASGWGENYYHNFYGMPTGSGFTVGIGPGAPPFNPHGVVGDVIDIGTSTLSVKDVDGDEQSIFVATATPIREMNNTISFTAIEVGDHVTIIGEPNDTGQVEARFIRVFTVPAVQ